MMLYLDSRLLRRAQEIGFIPAGKFEIPEGPSLLERVYGISKSCVEFMNYNSTQRILLGKYIFLKGMEMQVVDQIYLPVVQERPKAYDVFFALNEIFEDFVRMNVPQHLANVIKGYTEKILDLTADLSNYDDEEDLFYGLLTLMLIGYSFSKAKGIGN